MPIARRRFLGALAAACGAAFGGCAGDMAGPTGARGGPRVIDAHSHWYPQDFVDLVQKQGAAHGGKVGRNERPVEFIEGLAELSRQERDLLLGGNAARLFRI